MKTHITLCTIILFGLVLSACQAPGVIPGLGPATPTPDAYMTAAAGAQTRNAIESETSAAQFLSPTVPPPAPLPSSQAAAPTVAIVPTVLVPTVGPLPATPSSAPPPTSIPATIAPTSIPTMAAATAAPAGSLSGTHSIVNLHTQKCMEAPPDPNASTASVMQATCNGANNQLWDLVSVGSGYYQVVSRNSGKCLDIEDKHAAQNYDLVQSPCDNTTSQHWRIHQAGSYSDLMARSRAARHAASPIYTGTYYQIVAQHSNMCADLNAWQHDEGARILQYSCASSDNDNQLWGLK